MKHRAVSVTILGGTMHVGVLLHAILDAIMHAIIMHAMVMHAIIMHAMVQPMYFQMILEISKVYKLTEFYYPFGKFSQQAL